MACGNLARVTVGILMVCGTAADARAAHTQKLNAVDASNRAFFGFDVSLLGDGLLAGAPSDESAPGAAYLLDLTTGTQTHKLLPPASLPDDFFGFSTALTSNLAVVGDPGNPFADTLPVGRAYVYDRTTGDLERTLVASDSTSGDEFGFSMSAVGNRAIFGAPAGGQGAGAAYIYDVASGSETFKLTASDPVNGADFGYSVAISDQFAVVGAPGNFDTLGLVPGAAYVFDMTTGTQLMKLQPTDSVDGDEFGWSVAVDGSRAVIGAPAGGVGQGAAYLFDLQTGDQLFKLRPDVRVPGDDFGYNVAIDGNRAVVGSPGQDAVFGKAFLFDSLTGERLEKITPHDLLANDEYGFTVSLHGKRVAVASPRNESVTGLVDPGAVYLHEVPLQCGDLDRDNDVDAADLTTFLSNWTGFGLPGEFSKTFLDGDCDEDGDVDAADLTSFLQGWTGFLASADAKLPEAELHYDPHTGNVILDPTHAGRIIGFVLTSHEGIFDVDQLELPFANMGTNTDAVAMQVGQADLSGLGFTHPLPLGNVLPPGLTLEQLDQLLVNAQFVSGFGQGGQLTLVVVPEPLVLTPLAMGLLLVWGLRRRRVQPTSTRSMSN